MGLLWNFLGGELQIKWDLNWIFGILKVGRSWLVFCEQFTFETRKKGLSVLFFLDKIAEFSVFFFPKNLHGDHLSLKIEWIQSRIKSEVSRTSMQFITKKISKNPIKTIIHKTIQKWPTNPIKFTHKMWKINERTKPLYEILFQYTKENATIIRLHNLSLHKFV